MPRPVIGVPSEENVLCVLQRRGCVSLRTLCAELWPRLRWRPLLSGEDSVAEGILPDGRTRALWTWECLGTLLLRGRVRVAGHDLNEVDELAAATFELLRQRQFHAFPLELVEEMKDARVVALLHRQGQLLQ